ncbi:MAG TPA: hypothetical protein VMA53_22200 [Stellaceae bacterium]|nr:hypothetical protein [Stellaceae bacterium]
MSDAVATLLAEARAKRERAKRAKRLAGEISTPDVVRALLDYADRLEGLAVAAEERALTAICEDAGAQSRHKSSGRRNSGDAPQEASLATEHRAPAQR